MQRPLQMGLVCSHAKLVDRHEWMHGRHHNDRHDDHEHHDACTFHNDQHDRHDVLPVQYDDAAPWWFDHEQHDDQQHDHDDRAAVSVRSASILRRRGRRLHVYELQPARHSADLLLHHHEHYLQLREYHYSEPAASWLWPATRMRIHYRDRPVESARIFAAARL